MEEIIGWDKQALGRNTFGETCWKLSNNMQWVYYYFNHFSQNSIKYSCVQSWKTKPQRHCIALWGKPALPEWHSLLPTNHILVTEHQHQLAVEMTSRIGCFIYDYRLIFNAVDISVGIGTLLAYQCYFLTYLILIIWLL